MALGKSRTLSGRPKPRGKISMVSKIRPTKLEAYTADWASISTQVIARDGGRCTRCGKGRKEGVRLEAHHVIPVSRGGRTVMYNLKTLCGVCHTKQPFHSHLR